MATDAGQMPFIRNLASSDRKVRTAALTALQNFLSAKHISSNLAPLDILKLWKGLFYALWMCDRAIPQQKLCTELAGLINVLPDEAVIPWLRGFWATMAREWTGIDVLRMEKFLLLVRRVLGASLAWMRIGDDSWDAERVDSVLGLLEEWPFALEEEARTDEDLRREQRKNGGDSLVPYTVPVGLRLHVLDIWVDEAEKVGLMGAADESESSWAESHPQDRDILRRLTDMVDALEKRTTSPAVRIRSKDSQTDERLPWNRKPAGEERLSEGEARIPGDQPMADTGGDEGWGGFDD